LGTAALYAPLTLYPFILYDDEQYVTANPHVVSGISRANGMWAFTSGEAANWHPLTWLSHQLDCTLFGLNPAGHHAVSLLFHIANTLLIFFFLRRVTGAVGRSALVAALFAWHPLHVESVAWISERKDVLSTFFWMLTLIAYAGYARARSRQEPPETASNSPAGRGQAGAFYALTLLLFALGLMSKPMVVTLPFVLLLLDFWPLNRIRVRAAEAGQWDSSPPVERLRFLILEKIPFFALAAAGSVTATASTVCATMSKAGASARRASSVQSEGPGSRLAETATSMKPGRVGRKWLRFCRSVSTAVSPAAKVASGAARGTPPQ
jgi:hypothetical protein